MCLNVTLYEHCPSSYNFQEVSHGNVERMELAHDHV